MIRDLFFEIDVDVKGLPDGKILTADIGYIKIDLELANSVVIAGAVIDIPDARFGCRSRVTSELSENTKSLPSSNSSKISVLSMKTPT